MDLKIEMSKVLAEMQALKQRSQFEIDRPQDTSKIITGVAPGKKPDSFSNLLSSAINGVNDIQKESGRLRNAYETDTPGVSLSQVMVASQKSSIATQATIQVRNKFVEAYKDVMSMPI